MPKKGYKQTNEHSHKNKLARFANWNNEEYRNNQARKRRGNNSIKHFLASSKLWENPEYRQKQIDAHTKPVDTEKYPAKCEICGKHFKAIGSIHLRKHNISKENYVTLYPDAIMQSSWNKGKTKEIDERLLSISQKNSENQKGKPGRNKGKTWKLSDEARANIGKGSKKNWASPKYREKQDIQKKEYWADEDNKETRRQLMKLKWLDPEYQQKIYEGWTRSPNMQEQRILGILDKWDPDQWYYVGNGKLWINGKNPDFVNYERMHLLEFNGSFWHQDDNSEERINHFKKNGWGCSIIWDSDLDKLENKIVELIYI